MALVLRVTSYKGLPPTVAATVRVTDRDVTVGRHPGCQLELPDAECLVSGRHAIVSRQDHGYAIVDISTNGTFLNEADAPIPPNTPVDLHDGDKVGIGPYLLEVAVAEAADAPPAKLFERSEADILPGLSHPEASPDIMELLGPESGKPEAQSDHWSAQPSEPPRPAVEDMHLAVPTPPSDAARSVAPAQPAQEVEEPLIPDDHPADDVRASVGTPATAPDAIPEHYDLLSDAFVPSNSAADQVFDSKGESTSTVDTAPEAPAEPAVPADAPADVPVPTSSSKPPHRGRDDAAPPPAARRPAAAPELAMERKPGAELAAFLDGLGVGDLPDIDDSEDMLRLSGQLLRSMTEGLMAVMMARASFKSELRLEVTTIRSRDNNPFQFCADPEDALERLLWRRSRGFLDPPTAVRKSFNDIQAHQMAMIAGLRAAMRALLARFQPHALEKHFAGQSHLDKLLPMARKSKCWDLFVSAYDQVADDAAEDFLRLFGDAFNRAYEDQIRRLAAAQERDSA